MRGGKWAKGDACGREFQSWTTREEVRSEMVGETDGEAKSKFFGTVGSTVVWRETDFPFLFLCGLGRSGTYLNVHLAARDGVGPRWRVRAHRKRFDKATKHLQANKGSRGARDGTTQKKRGKRTSGRGRQQRRD